MTDPGKFIFTCMIAVNLILLSSCDETPVEIPDRIIVETGRAVLLEELTGVRCPNCPRGAAAIEQILELYKNQVFAIGIHGDFLTTPLSQSSFDFRNDFARQLENFHKPFLGKPSGIINRILFDDQDFAAIPIPDLWLSYVESELQKSQELSIVLNTSYNNVSRILNVGVSVGSLINENSEFRISVFLTEGGMIDYQETLGDIIPDFEHNHVLRHMLTRFDGDALQAGLSEGEVINRTYSYEIPEEFIAENMEVVVAVHRAEPNNKTVLQAAGKKLGN
jgi:hypothetical protein